MPSRAFKNLRAARARKLAEQAATSGSPAQNAITPSNAPRGSAVEHDATGLNHGTASTTQAAHIQNVIPQGSVDVLKRSAIDRKLLREGPKIRIFEGNTFLVDLPRRLFFAASTKASELLDATTDVILPEGTGHLAIITTSTGFVGVCKAARALGMDRYISHIHGHYWHSIKSDIPNGEETPIIESLGAGDPFIDCLGSRYAYLLRQGQIRNGQNFLKWIEQYPRVWAKILASKQEYERRQLNLEAAMAQKRTQQAAQYAQWGLH